MYTTYHLSSAQEINTDILDAIKAAFKTKAITIIVEEQQAEDIELTTEMKAILDERLTEAENTYIPAGAVMENLKKKFIV
jgi:regulator of protease activity HflC (stomatin/prohibitin superfamily)